MENASLGMEDAKKARWYVERLVKQLEQTTPDKLTD
jgi:hypothetical protein